MQPKLPNALGASSTPQKSQHLWDYWAVIMKQAWVVVLSLFVSICVAVVVTQKQEKLYAARCVLQLIPPRVLQASMVPAILSDENYLETQLEMMRMTETAQQAVAAAELKDRKDFEDMTEAEIVRKLAGNVKVSKRRRNYLVDLSVEGPDPALLDDLANALAEQFRNMQRSETKQRRAKEKASYEETIEQADMRIRALHRFQRIEIFVSK